MWLCNLPFELPHTNRLISLIDWLTDWLTDWFDWLTDWPDRRLTDRLITTHWHAFVHVLSPVYIDSSSDMALVAQRLMWGKFTNSGQTCIAPDYVLCSADVQASQLHIFLLPLHISDHSDLTLGLNFCSHYLTNLFAQCSMFHFKILAGIIGADSPGQPGTSPRYSRKNRGKRCILPRYLSWLCYDFLRCEFNSVIIVQ